MDNGNFTTTAIITKGLTGGYTLSEPCKTGIITSYFSLYFTEVEPPPPPVIPPSGGGGPYPGNAWNKLNPGELQDFYTPTQPLTPVRDDVFKQYTFVTLKVNIRGIKIEKDYAIPKKKAHIVVKILSLIDSTMIQLNNIKLRVANISITNLVPRPTKIIAAIKNMRVKK